MLGAEPGRQSCRCQELAQRRIRAREPQVGADPFQVRIQGLERLSRRRVEIADGFRVEDDTLQTRAGIGDQRFQPLGEERRVRKDERRIER